MRVSAKADYAVRAAIELAANGSDSSSPLKGERIADAQGIPLKFLENILVDLRHAGLVNSRRGPDGGYWLARPRPTSARRRDPRRRGPAGQRPRREARGPRLRRQRRAAADVWVALRASLRDVLEHVTLADVVAGKLPQQVATLTREPGAWAAALGD